MIGPGIDYGRYSIGPPIGNESPQPLNFLNWTTYYSRLQRSFLVFGRLAVPIYEYQCAGCGHKFEAIQRISDSSLTDCPECNEPALKKLISAAGFRLKGGGWYETDFKKSDIKKNLVADKSGSESSTSKESSSGTAEKASTAEKTGS